MISRSKLKGLYEDKGFSMQEIADELRCSINKVQYWMDKYQMKRRSRSDALYIKHNPNGDPFKIKEKFNESDLVLLGLGLGLWWGEGNKRHSGVVRLGNSDPLLIRQFILFLERICGVDKKKLRFGLQIFSDINPDEAKSYWIDSLGVESSQFHPRIIVTQTGKIGTYRKKSKYGVLTLYCSNIKLRAVFDDLMKKFAYELN